MKTAKEKAAELYSKMLHKIEGLEGTDWYESAKQCALIAVDEIINAIDWHNYETPNKELDFWQEVKDEIELL
jgi:hypothetical protein